MAAGQDLLNNILAFFNWEKKYFNFVFLFFYLASPISVYWFLQVAPNAAALQESDGSDCVHVRAWNDYSLPTEQKNISQCSRCTLHTGTFPPSRPPHPHPLTPHAHMIELVCFRLERVVWLNAALQALSVCVSAAFFLFCRTYKFLLFKTSVLRYFEQCNFQPLIQTNATWHDWNFSQETKMQHWSTLYCCTAVWSFYL